MIDGTNQFSCSNLIKKNLNVNSLIVALLILVSLYSSVCDILPISVSSHQCQYIHICLFMSLSRYVHIWLSASISVCSCLSLYGCNILFISLSRYSHICLLALIYRSVSFHIHDYPS